MRSAPLAAALVAAATLLAGCSGTAPSVSAGPTAAAVPAAGSSLGPADFAAAAKLPNTVVLDVRTPQEFAAGHLPGATNFDVESADFPQKIASLDKAATYAVYCRSGNRSKVAMSSMQQAGFTQLFDLAGGINAWTSAGGAITT